MNTFTGTVVITQSGERGKSLVKRLLTQGVNARHVPLIETVPYPAQQIAPQMALWLENPDTAMCFTSATAARVFSQVCSLPRDSRRHAAICYCIGEATASELRQAGFNVIVFKGVGNAADLADAIIDSDPQKRMNYIFVRGQKARRTLVARLADAGLQIVELEVYDTVAAQIDAKQIWQFARPVVWVLFSPSGVEALTASDVDVRLHVESGQAFILAFGTTTRQALWDAGLPVHDTAPAVTHEGLLDAIFQFINR